MINKTGAQLFSQQNFQYLTGKTIQKEEEEEAEIEVIFPEHEDNKKSIKSEHTIRQEQNEKLDKDLKPSSTAGSSLNTSMTGSGSIGLDDSEGDYEKIKEFFSNCLFLSMLQVFGPIMTTYLVYKYEILKNMPLKMKIQTFIYITSKAVIISLSVWIMGASILFSEMPTKDYNYYKVEFIFNCVTGVLVTLAGSFLGRNALFNNQFFSQIYYLSEDKIKKQKKKEEEKKARQSNASASAAMGQKSTNDKNTLTEESINPQEGQSPQIFQILQRERKIQQRMAKIMKRLFIDSQTFTLQMLQSRQLNNKINNDISGKEGLPRKVPALEPINRRDIELLKNLKQTHLEKDRVLNSKSQKEDTIKIDSHVHVQQVQLEQLREFPIGNKNFTCEQDHGQNWLKPITPDDHNSVQRESFRTIQAEEEDKEDEFFDDQQILEENVQLNGRKLCNELLLQCEKVESLKHKRFKRFIFGTFLLFKGMLPCFFRMKDGLNFFGSNIIVGMTCQLNRQIVYGVFIGFLMFSMDLDIMNCFTAMVNNLLTYKRYLVQTDEKDGEDEEEEQENDGNSSPNNETQKVNKLKQNNKNNQELPKENEHEDLNMKGQAAANSENSRPKKKDKLWKKIFQIGTDLPDEGEGQVEEGGESSYLLDNEGTPAIDFTDISSVMAWNNMRKLGFHHKQNDIEMIDRVSFIFWVEVLIILLLFIMSYSSLITLGEEFQATWVVTMLVMDIFIVVFSQLSRVHIQVQINKSFLSSVRAVMKVKQLLQQSKIIDLQRHIIVGRHKKRKGEIQSINQTDSIYDFYARIKRKLDAREKNDKHYYDKLSKLVQFVQEDIKYDMENDQLKFLGLITATPAFEATLLTSVLGCIYWLFRAYMKYLNVDLGLLGE